jgi:hypothetical protein
MMYRYCMLGRPLFIPVPPPGGLPEKQVQDGGPPAKRLKTEENLISYFHDVLYARSARVHAAPWRAAREAGGRLPAKRLETEENLIGCFHDRSARVHTAPWRAAREAGARWRTAG